LLRQSFHLLVFGIGQKRYFAEYSAACCQSLVTDPGWLAMCGWPSNIRWSRARIELTLNSGIQSLFSPQSSTQSFSFLDPEDSLFTPSTQVRTLLHQLLTKKGGLLDLAKELRPILLAYNASLQRPT